jgi:hypothetical protein
VLSGVKNLEGEGIRRAPLVEEREVIRPMVSRRANIISGVRRLASRK